MVIAKTEMDKIPEQCRECDLSNVQVYGTYCFVTGSRICVDGIRSDCPLHDIPDDALDGPDWHREK